MSEETVVIFRKWNKGHKDIIALFPYVKCSIIRPHLCDSYIHFGQHGCADYSHVVRNSKLATPEEYKELLEELKLIGYKLKIRKKRSGKR